jgi:ArsR family transcriptional regulator
VLLKKGELCACQIRDLLKVTGATVSRHMGFFIQAHLVTSRKEGRWVYYQIYREHIDTDLYTFLHNNLEKCTTAQQDAESIKDPAAC